MSDAANKVHFSPPCQKGLFQRWLSLELESGKSLKVVLDEINEACQTAYRHNWPSKMASRGYSTTGIPICVRRYMFRKVLADEMKRRKKSFSPADIEDLTIALS